MMLNLVLNHFHAIDYIFIMTPWDSLLQSNNGSSIIRQLALIAFFILEYIYIYIYTHLYLELIHIHRVLLIFFIQLSVEWKSLLCHECFSPIKTSGIYKYFDIKIVLENNQTIMPGDLYLLHQVENKNLKPFS